MQAIQLHQFDPNYTGLRVVDIPKPSPQKGELLVRVICAPVNPSDIMMLTENYIISGKPPFIPGLVAVGEVIESNAGFLGKLMNSRRVAFASSHSQNGTWAEFTISTPQLCLPLSNNLSDEDGVNLLSNAATAIGLMDTLQKYGHSTVIVTAAASEVGRMMNTIAPEYRMTLLNVVRSQEQISVLHQLGAQYILDMTTDDFSDKLKHLAHKLNTRAAIDSIAGEMPNLLMEAMPERSMILILGRLSEKPITFDGITQLVGKQHILRGFSINEWFLQKSLIGQLRAGMKAQKLLLNGYKTQVQHRVSLSVAAEKLAELTQRATQGKTLIYPSL
jgi:NADPH:quinone reductase